MEKAQNSRLGHKGKYWTLTYIKKKNVWTQNNGAGLINFGDKANVN